ncbi:DUF2567 domain-containing protein [Actinoplanes sp. NBC_00393]|uniref:hypothetical protein n=1 Tax=Actinoplanes sp. NBC_00393 TaxID=2975953 RepID=UPI002E204D87
MHPSEEPAEPPYRPDQPYQPEQPGRWSVQRWGIEYGSRRPWRRTLTVAVVLTAVVSALGVPLGLLWAWLAPGVPVVDIGDNGVVVNDPSPEQYIAADGWFTLLGLGFGILVAVAAWLVLRRDRGPFLLLGVVLGTSIAGHWVAPFVGELIGRDDYDQWRATAARGATFLAPPEVHSLGPTLVPAFAAAIVLTLLAGWSNDPDLDHPGAQPGYGPNHPGMLPGYPGYPGAYDVPDHRVYEPPFDQPVPPPGTNGAGVGSEPAPPDPNRPA